MPKLKYGIGRNSKGKYRATINNKGTIAYNIWGSMFKRCYCPKFQKKYPTYIGCKVSSEWHDFQDFAYWYYSQPNKDTGYHLDKDLLFPGNKVYSPDTCCLVPIEINNLLLDRASCRGDHPRGVSFNKVVMRFDAKLRISGKTVNLGYFDCPQEAHQAYKKAKERYVKNKALDWANRIEWNVFLTLMNWQLETD